MTLAYWSYVAIVNEWNSFCREYKECLCVHCKQAYRCLKPVNKKTKTVLKIASELRNNVYFCLRFLLLPVFKALPNV